MMAHHHVIDITANDDVGASSSNYRSSWRMSLSNNPRLWICGGEAVLIVSEIVASVVVLSLSSKDENPRGPLFMWITVYAWVRVAALPILCWRYYYESPNHHHHHQESLLVELFSGLVQLLEFLVHSYFLFIWLVAGICVLLLGGKEFDHEPRSLHLLFGLFLTVMYIRFIFGIRQELQMITQTTPAPQWIKALPTYNFKINNSDQEGGVIAAGTEKERMISQEDAVCCICLANYQSNDELKELLPCSHLFHKDCIDKWLRINALCPLCKSEVGKKNNLTGTVDEGGENIGVDNGLTNTSLS